MNPHERLHRSWWKPFLNSQWLQHFDEVLILFARKLIFLENSFLFVPRHGEHGYECGSALITIFWSVVYWPPASLMKPYFFRTSTVYSYRLICRQLTCIVKRETCYASCRERPRFLHPSTADAARQKNGVHLAITKPWISGFSFRLPTLLDSWIVRAVNESPPSMLFLKDGMNLLDSPVLKNCLWWSHLWALFLSHWL